MIPALVNQDVENHLELGEHVALAIGGGASLYVIVDGLDCRDDLEELE